MLRVNKVWHSQTRLFVNVNSKTNLEARERETADYLNRFLIKNNAIVYTPINVSVMFRTEHKVNLFLVSSLLTTFTFFLTTYLRQWL